MCWGGEGLFLVMTVTPLCIKPYQTTPLLIIYLSLPPTPYPHPWNVLFQYILYVILYTEILSFRNWYSVMYKQIYINVYIHHINGNLKENRYSHKHPVRNKQRTISLIGSLIKIMLIFYKHSEEFLKEFQSQCYLISIFPYFTVYQLSISYTAPLRSTVQTKWL